MAVNGYIVARDAGFTCDEIIAFSALPDNERKASGLTVTTVTKQIHDMLELAQEAITYSTNATNSFRAVRRALWGSVCLRVSVNI